MYKDCDIPAKLFFKIINTGDYSLLGKGNNKQREKAFDDIMDEFYVLDNNQRIGNLYKKRVKIAMLQLKIQFITDLLIVLTRTPLKNNERSQIIDALNGIDGVKINFLKSNDINILQAEVLRVQRSVLGSLNNQLKIEESTEQKAVSEEKTVIKFEAELVRLSRVIGFQINPEITLREFVAYKASAIETVNQQKKQQSKNGK